MHTAPKVHPLALAVCGALALMAAPTHAQRFDPNSAAVRQAYVGATTQEKKDAALAGLRSLGALPLIAPITSPGGSGGGLILGSVSTNGTASTLIVAGSLSDPFSLKPISSAAPLVSTIQVAKESDLPTSGPGGFFVSLDNVVVRASANFNTSREMVIGPNGTVIDTNGFNLSVASNLTANGMLVKDGAGTLILSGQNTGLEPLWILNGVVEGSGASLPRTIINHGTIRLTEGLVGTIGSASAAGEVPNIVKSSPSYSGIPSALGNLEKIGPGTATLSGTSVPQGTTTILQGTLELTGLSLFDRQSVHVGAGATLDLRRAGSALSREQFRAGLLSGAGNILLGSTGYIAVSADGDSTFSGVISGRGGISKISTGTFTLTGINTYEGSTGISKGTLALVGNGRLSPLNAVSMSGGTFDISRSTNDQEVGSIFGYGAVNLGDKTLTVGADNTSRFYFSSSFDGNITGSGGLTKIGIGSLNLSGQNAYTGITTISQGTLIAETQSISNRVVNNATLTFAEDKGATPFISEYSGTITGTGKVTKDGTGIIWLRGRNNYTGGTEVKDGILIGNTDSLQGNITNNAALAFYQVDNGTYSGTLSGNGSLYQYGPGTLTLTGDNTYAGGTAFSGTLRVNRDANLGAASGAVVIAGGTLQLGADLTTARTIALSPAGGTIDTNGFKLSTDVSSRISGPGMLTKTGAGTLSLNGTDDPFAVVVTAGRLEVKNVLSTNNVAVSAGAELGGTGYIFGNVNNSGRLARGDGIGAINVEGHVSFDPGSIFLVKTDAAGNSDRLLLTSHRAILNTSAQATTVAPLPPRATLNGGTVDVRAETGNYRRETRYNILTTEGGVTGQFNSVTSNLAFLDPSLSYDPNNVYLTLKRNDLNYATVAQNSNQMAVAQGLTRMANGATGDAATVTAALDGLSAQQARAAFDSIGAAGRAALPQVGSVTQRSVNQNLVARLGLADSGNSLAPATGIAGRGVQLAFDDSTRNDAAPLYAQLGLPAGTGFRASGSDTHNGLWLRGYGGSGRLDGDASAPGAKYHFGGALLGYDHKFGNATIGVFAGYGEPRYNQDFSASSAKTKTAQTGIYGRYANGGWHVDGVASYARNDTDTSRVVSVGGLNRLATGSFKGDALSAHIETGYTIKAGGFEVQPLAAMSWVRQNQNAYSETGAGALNLILPDQNQDSLRSSLGARTLHPFTTAGMQWMFETRAAWSHEFKTTRSVNARLAGDPAAGVFTVSGPNVPRDTAVLGVGIAAQASKNLRLYADLNTELNGANRAYALSAGLRYQW